MSLSRIDFDDLQAIDQILLLLLRSGFFQLNAQLLRQLDQIEFVEQLADGFGAHVGLEHPFTVLFSRRTVLFLGQQLLWVQARWFPGSITT